MDEEIQMTAGAALDRIGHETNAITFELLQAGLDIGNAQSDVVHAFSSANEKASDGRVFAERLQQFQAAVAKHDHGELDLLLLHDFVVADFKAKHLVERLRRLQALDRDAEMIDGGGAIFQRV